MPQLKYDKQLTDTGKWLLDIAEQIRQRTDGLDTAVRDSVSEGLARIVMAGNDCTASAMPNLTTDQWMSFIDTQTADWFRSRDYAEWFCIGAAAGFRNSRPRALSFDRCDNPLGRRKPRRTRKRKAKANATPA